MTLANPQEGGKRREEQHIHPTRLVTPEGSADDGKRSYSDGRFIVEVFKRSKGREFEGGWARGRAGADVGGLFLRVFFWVFSVSFSR